MTPSEASAAYNPLSHRNAHSAEAREWVESEVARKYRDSLWAKSAFEALRARQEVERARRASRRRKRVLVALECVGGAFTCAFVLWCAWKLTMLLAR